MQKQAVLITGGGIRLGRAIALSLAEKGIDIALHYNSSKIEAEETARIIRSLGIDCELFPLNLKDISSFQSYIEKVKYRFPHLHILINSASSYTQKSIKDTDEKTFDEQFQINLKAPFFLSQAFYKVIDKGNIINILDNKINYRQFQYAAYLLSKKALAEFTLMAALEFAPAFRVNGIAPGVILPLPSRSKEYLDWRISAIPLQKKGETHNITTSIWHLIENDFISGQILHIDGAEGINFTGRNAGDYDPGKI